MIVFNRPCLQFCARSTEALKKVYDKLSRDPNMVNT